MNQSNTKIKPKYHGLGAIRGDGLRILCDGKVDSNEYQRILSEGLPTIYGLRNIF
jgi:hypothetical protein